MELYEICCYDSCGRKVANMATARKDESMAVRSMTLLRRRMVAKAARKHRADHPTLHGRPKPDFVGYVWVLSRGLEVLRRVDWMGREKA